MNKDKVIKLVTTFSGKDFKDAEEAYSWLDTELRKLLTPHLSIEKVIKENRNPDIAKIVIEEDGWVWVRDRQGTETGLGDIGVDVKLEDNRNPAKTSKDK